MAALLEGVKDLSTRARIDWWANHENAVLPADVALFAVPATMPGAGEPPESLDNSVLFSTGGLSSTDWWLNRMFYYASYGDTGKQCQDGQVSCDRAVFWPSLLERFGWDTAGREIGVLSVMGTHHWGLALPFALDGVPSRVPRAALLDTIGSMAVKREVDRGWWFRWGWGWRGGDL